MTKHNAFTSTNAGGSTRQVLLVARVEVQVSATDPDATTRAVAELRRTLEMQGYSPSIDVKEDTR